MPYKSEKIKLDETQDRRRKLTEDQKAEIKKYMPKENVALDHLQNNSV